MSSPSPEPALLIFDLDGTLVDSGPQITRAWGRILARLGRAALPQDQVETMVGDGAAKLVERGLAATGGKPETPAFDDIVDQYAQVLAREPLNGDDLYPGVPETLRNLAYAGHQMAICTNKPAAAAETALSMTAIRSYFELVIGGDSATALKPDPAPVRAILNQLRRKPDQAVMIGDHGNDVRAARAAGVPSILVSYGYPDKDPELPAANRIDHFDALPAAIAEISRARIL